jgi:hypothetical protein
VWVEPLEAGAGKKRKFVQFVNKRLVNAKNQLTNGTANTNANLKKFLFSEILTRGHLSAAWIP